MKKLSLASKTFLGFALGIVIGLIFKQSATALQPIGDLFLNLIKMIVVPLIFFSITTGITSIGDITKLRKIGFKTLLYFIATTALAGLLGILVANLIKPGLGVVLDAGSKTAIAASENQELPSFGKMIVDMFPSNPVQALAEGNLMQIIVFAIFLGISCVLIGDKADPVLKVIQTGSDIMMKMTEIVMQFSPIGVTALMAATIGEYGLKVFGPLAKLILSDYAGLIAVLLLVYIPLLIFVAKVPLKKFFKFAPKLWVVTASTTSSSGSLPVTIDVASNDLGVEEELSTFVLPLGATMNMNGAVVYYATAVVFVSQMYGIHLSISQQILTVLSATLISVGSPGIPGGGIVMTIMLLNLMGLPADVVGMIAGMYRILDMGHTTINCTGDLVSTLCIARTNKMFHKDPSLR